MISKRAEMRMRQETRNARFPTKLKKRRRDLDSYVGKRKTRLPLRLVTLMYSKMRYRNQRKRDDSLDGKRETKTKRTIENLIRRYIIGVSQQTNTHAAFHES